jgi:hypothetical protein
MPDSFTAAQALLFQGLTAQYLATEYRDVRPGDRVLVHSAAGGVGLTSSPSTAPSRQRSNLSSSRPSIFRR